MSAAAFRARSATELIDVAFQLLRRNFLAFYTLSALFTVPIYILPPLLFPETRGLAGAAGAAAGLGGYSFVAFLVYFVLFIVLSAIFHTALFLASADAYLGRPIVIADALNRAKGRAVAMGIGYIYQSLAIGLASLLFLIPGIFVAISLFAMPPVIALEGADASTASSRSSSLSKGLKGHIFLTGLLAIVLYIVGLIIMMMIAGLVGGLGHTTVVTQIVTALGASAILPIWPIVVTLLYFDARIRKEGYDIELMAQSVGGSGSTPANPQPA